MRRHFLVVVIAAVALYTADTRVSGQGAQQATTGTSATATPRMPDGHPDLNGYWYRRAAPITTKRDGGSVVIVDAFAGLRQIHPGTPRTFTLRPPEDEIEEAAFCEDRDTSLKQDLSYHSNIR